MSIPFTQRNLAQALQKQFQQFINSKERFDQVNAGIPPNQPTLCPSFPH